MELNVEHHTDNKTCCSQCSNSLRAEITALSALVIGLYQCVKLHNRKFDLVMDELLRGRDPETVVRADNQIIQKEQFNETEAVLESSKMEVDPPRPKRRR
jgi:hypothetical protein